VVLSSVGVVEESPVSSVDPSDDEESTLGGSKSVGGESLLSPVDPSDDEESPVSPVDPSDDEESPVSPVEPLAYRVVEAGKITKVAIKNNNKLDIRFNVSFTTYVF
jgi:hypothetical protein